MPEQPGPGQPGSARTPNPDPIGRPAPISDAIGRSITSDHIGRGLDIADRFITAKTTGGHSITKLNLWLNYGVIIIVVGVLAWLNMQGTLPAEALTGFLGTGIGYWLATSFQTEPE